MTQQSIVKGNAQQKLGSAGFIIGALLLTIGGLLLPPSLGVSKWVEEIKQVGEQAMLLQACALLITFGYWGVMIGTLGIYRSIVASGENVSGAAWARVGFYFHLMGTAMWTIGMFVGDVAIPAAAAKWLAAPVADQNAMFGVITAITGITRGLFPMEVIVVWLAFAFLGTGMVRSDVYPRWLGWIGLVLGIFGVFLGILQTFNGRESTLGTFMALNISTILWTLITGIWVARKAWQ